MNPVATNAMNTAALPDVHAFETGAFDPEHFNHEAHVHVAWCYLQQYPLAEAITRFTTALRALTVRLNAAMKYHETISWFFMIEIADRQAASPGCSWEIFRRNNGDLIEDAAALLRRHYSPARLASPKARRRFVLPDLAPAERPHAR